jgi:hypothetical protein
MCFDESEDQAAMIGLIYSHMSEENRKKFFGDVKTNQWEAPLESYKMIILDFSEDAQNNNTAGGLST